MGFLQIASWTVNKARGTEVGSGSLWVGTCHHSLRDSQSLKEQEALLERLDLCGGHTGDP